MLYSDEDFFRVIGHISVFFATLDYLVTEVIIKLSVPEPHQMLSEHMTLGQKFELLSKLTDDKVTNPEMLKYIKGMLPEAQEISRERNRYIHDQWVFQPHTIPFGRIGRLKLGISKKGLATSQMVELTIEELHDFLNRIGRCQCQFGSLLEQLKSVPLRSDPGPSPARC